MVQKFRLAPLHHILFWETWCLRLLYLLFSLQIGEINFKVYQDMSQMVTTVHRSFTCHFNQTKYSENLDKLLLFPCTLWMCGSLSCGFMSVGHDLRTVSLDRRISTSPSNFLKGFHEITRLVASVNDMIRWGEDFFMCLHYTSRPTQVHDWGFYCRYSWCPKKALLYRFLEIYNKNTLNNHRCNYQGLMSMSRER